MGSYPKIHIEIAARPDDFVTSFDFIEREKTMSTQLKIKILSLSAEAVIIRRQEHKLAKVLARKGKAKGKAVAELEFDAESPALSFLRDLGIRLPGNKRLEDALDDNLRVQVKLFVRRSASDRGQQLIDTLGLELRESIDNVALELRDGRTIKGKDLKIVKRVTLRAQDGLVEMSDVFEKMRDWLQELVQEGIVEA